MKASLLLKTDRLSYQADKYLEKFHMHLDFTNTQFEMEAFLLYFTKKKLKSSIEDGLPII